MAKITEPCPFCGVDADDIDESSPMLVVSTSPCPHEDHCYVECQGCGARGAAWSDEKDAISAWNRRAAK